MHYRFVKGTCEPSVGSARDGHKSTVIGCDKSRVSAEVIFFFFLEAEVTLEVT